MAKITVTVGSEKTRTYTGPKWCQESTLGWFISQHDPFARRPVSERLALDSKEAAELLRR
jgi:hypothetical protein